MKFTEARLETAIIELLGKQGYPHVLGETISREPGEVLIKEDLKNFLAGQYADDNITANEIDAIIRQLETLPASDLYESNKTIMKMVADGFLLKREDRNQKDLYIQLIDYSDLTAFRTPKAGEVATVIADPQKVYGTGNNIFKMVNQFEIFGYERRIPDGILYINGLPLVVFEFKSAVREDATIHDAFIQLTVRYKRDIPELFKYNAFLVISDGVNSKAGSFFAPYEFFYSWRQKRDPHPRSLSQGEKGEQYYRGGFEFSGLVDIARELRKKQTPAETVMWQLLRNRQCMGLKFRRQHQIGDYIVDFFCNERSLVIELDGAIHQNKEQHKKDTKRDAYLNALGFTILRIKNEEFLSNPESTLQNIVKTSLKASGSSPLGRGGGEGYISTGGSAAVGINTLYTLIQGLFNKHTLRDVIRNFIYLPDSSRKEEKILAAIPNTMRPPNSTPTSKPIAAPGEMARAAPISGPRAAARALPCSF